MMPNQENMDRSPPLSVFQAASEMSLVHVLLFKFLNYLSSVGYLEGNNVVSIRKG